MVARWGEGVGMGEKAEGIKKYKMVLTEQLWGYKGQYRKWLAKELTCMTH